MCFSYDFCRFEPILGKFGACFELCKRVPGRELRASRWDVGASRPGRDILELLAESWARRAEIWARRAHGRFIILSVLARSALEGATRPGQNSEFYIKGFSDILCWLVNFESSRTLVYCSKTEHWRFEALIVD